MAEKLKSFRVKGLMCPPITPFTADGEVNYDIIPAYVQHHLDFGVPNVFLTGTTGEGINLTLTERKKVVEAWMAAGRGKLDSIVVHIGAANLKDTQELAVHAQQVGADAVCCVCPSYFKPVTVEDYVAYMQQVASVVPNLPFYLYDIDFMTGIFFSMNDFCTLAKERIPNFKGLKHTSPSFTSMNTVLLNHPDLEVWLGSETEYLESLAIGMDVTIPNSYIGHVLNRCKAAFDRGDMKSARLEQNRAVQVVNIRKKYGLSFPGGTKVILRALGLEVGGTRLPLPPVSDSVVEKVKKELQDIGFFDWATKP